MRWLLAPFVLLALAVPAAAEVRPVARPVPALAEKADSMPRPVPRPGPAVAHRPVRLVIAVSPEDLARRLAREPIAPATVVLPVMAKLLRPDAVVATPAKPALVVTRSASNAPASPDAAAAVRAAFAAVPGPALQPRKRPSVPGVTAVSRAVSPTLRPVARPLSAVVAPGERVVQVAAVLLRPAKRPANLKQRAPAPEAEAQIVQAAAIRVKPGEQLVKPKKGSVCGDRRIRGETLPPIPAKVKGCGIAQPVRVTEVDGVRLSPAATIDCTTAKALKSWVSSALKPAAGARGVSGLQVAASYACRSRNNIRGARISEHGRGKAIDIAAVVLGDGQVIDVLGDYRRDRGKFLRAAHKSACGIFGTTLGPGSDGYHENHLHFDTASHRGGAYCR